MPREIPLGDDVFSVERPLWDEDEDRSAEEPFAELETSEQKQRRRERAGEAERRLREDLADLEAVIADRFAHGATEEGVQADRARLTALRDLDDFPDEEPLLVELPTRTGPTFDPVAAFQAALEAELTPAELEHWRLYIQRARQADIAVALGVSQGAVSKREPRLIAKVDAIRVRHLGGAYSQTITDRGQWGRPGRRRPPQE